MDNKALILHIRKPVLKILSILSRKVQNLKCISGESIYGVETENSSYDNYIMEILV
jgi:hypothetical protein